MNFHSLTIRQLVLLSVLSIRIVQAADGCYYKNSDGGIQVALAQYPCTSSGGVQVCCNLGDTCGDDSICRSNSGLTAVSTSSSAIRASSTVATTRTSSVVAATSTTVSRVTTPPVSSTVTPAASGIYTISSISLPLSLLSSLSISLPTNINLIPRQSTSYGNFYIGGCTDSSYNSPECSNHCTGYSMQNIIYDSSTSAWSCCGNTLADCSTPTSETFDGIPPSSFGAVSVISSISSRTSSIVVSTSTFSPASPAITNSSNSTGLSPGASVGIAFGVIIPVLFVLATAIGFCMRRRKLRAQRRAQIDRALSEELAGGMRSTDSWYEGPTLRGETLNPPPATIGTLTSGGGGVDASGHTFAYETPAGLMQVKLKEQAAVARRMPLQLQLARLHFNLGNRRGGRNTLNRNPSGMIVSPQDEATSPIRRRGGLDMGMVEGRVAEEMEGSPTGAGTWPAAPPSQRPWEFQRSVVSLREMDGTGVNPLEQRQSEDTEAEYEDVTVNTDSTVGSDEWQVQRPWRIQQPPSLRDMDGTGRLHLPAW